jgi:hypothetical protein
MRDELALLREARPNTTGPSPELARETRSRLLSEIGRTRRRTFRRRAVLLVAATAVAASAALAGLTLADRGGSPAWAGAVVKVAETAPRLLLDAPGWKVSRADELGIGHCEMTFSQNGRRLDLKWDRGAEYTKLADPRSGAEPLGAMTVQGATARLFRYTGSTDFVATWSKDGYGLQARGVSPDLATFRALVATLQEVEVDTWLSAMPASVVKPEGRSKIVLEMLEGVPLPPRFEVAQLLRARDGAVLDRYQLGAQVAGAVACAWLDRWVAARREGDDRGLRQSVGALATSHEWRVLLDMNAEGDYPEVLWLYADAVAANAPIQAGGQLTVEQSFRAALGCHAR